jgi:hypothetical protein
MKSKSIKSAIAAETTDFDAAMAAVHSAVNTNEPITDKEKQGSKVSNKELALTSYAIEYLPKIEHKLPRDFDEVEFTILCSEFDGLETKRDELLGILNHINAQMTSRRVKIKTGYKIIYTASQAATDDNHALKYISDKLGEIYAKSSTAAEMPKTPAPEKAAV